MSLIAYTKRPASDGSSLLLFSGPANVVVAWAITLGAGSVTPLAGHTDALGHAWAVYRPLGHTGPVTIEVQHGS